MIILDGKKLSEKIKAQIKEKIQKEKIKATLGIILVGEDESSKIYIRRKIKFCEEVGIGSKLFKFDNDISQNFLIEKINEINLDKEITGFIVQLPIPAHIDKSKIINLISKEKDVDGFTATNFGNIIVCNPDFGPLPPATPSGIMMLLDEYGISIEGKNICIISNSDIIGKPLALMMSKKQATPIICNKYTKNLKDFTLMSDIIVSCTGILGFLKEDMVPVGAIVIDVGIGKDKNGKISGDVDFENVSKKCSYITPVPGGVGVMTVASLISNLINAYKIQQKNNL